MLQSDHNKNKIFNTLAVLSSIAAAYHFFGMFSKMDQLPVWRHGIFLILDVFCVYGLVKRPRFFVIFFVAFTMQQLYVHGSDLYEMWKYEHRIHWNSVFVLAILPVALVLLITDFFHQFDNLISFNELEGRL
ncbi:MAG TPA: hypothetical protein VM012_15650 [Flavitalea sp.]|nr:hypothetical protein [Flavitalea sp.]